MNYLKHSLALAALFAIGFLFFWLLESLIGPKGNILFMRFVGGFSFLASGVAALCLKQIVHELLA